MKESGSIGNHRFQTGGSDAPIKSKSDQEQRINPQKAADEIAFPKPGIRLSMHHRISDLPVEEIRGQNKKQIHAAFPDAIECQCRMKEDVVVTGMRKQDQDDGNPAQSIERFNMVRMDIVRKKEKLKFSPHVLPENDELSPAVFKQGIAQGFIPGIVLLLAVLGDHPVEI